MNMNLLSKNLRERMEAIGIKQNELAERANVSQVLIHKLLSGKVKSTTKVVELSQALGCTAEELLYGEKTESADQKTSISSMKFDLWDDETALSEDEVALPFYREVELSAGTGSSMVQENHGRKLLFSKRTLKDHNVEPANAACVLVNGNSMEPVIPHGSTAGVDISKRNIKDGKIYAVDNGGLLQVKQLYRLPGGGVKLRSYNQSDFEDQDILPEKMKDFNIIGWVFWWSVMNKWD